MKYRGFTLAEALITLAILGVIAAISIPQVVTMAQKHQSETMISKIVYQTELGVQKMISDYNLEKGGMSYVDKILPVDKWQEKLPKVIRLTEKSYNVAQNNFLMAPAYAEEVRKISDQTTCTYNGKTITCIFNNDEPELGITSRGTTKCTHSHKNPVEVCHKEFSFRAGIYHNSDTIEDEECNNVDGCRVCVTTKLEDNFDGKGFKKTVEESSSCPEPEKPKQEEPIADIPEPEPTEPVVILDGVYHVFGLPAEVRLAVFNASDSDKFKADKNLLTMVIDTNGFERKPNKAGVDEFEFVLTNSGKMIPNDDATREFVKNGYKIK